jgi:N-methylhydantoinase B/oxoprolinase/acetone carboxylase alpha subunit
MKEFLVTTGGTSAASAPTWTNADTPGQTVASNTVTFTSIAQTRTYAFNTVFALGDVVKPSAASAEEYLVTTAGTSDTTALTASVSASVTRGTAVFKRIV